MSEGQNSINQDENVKRPSKIVVLDEGNSFLPKEISSCSDCISSCGGKSLCAVV